MLRSPLLRYLTAPLTVALALLLELLLWPIMQQSRTPLFFIAVVASSWLGGVGVGLLATFLSLLVLNYFFTPPEYTLSFSFADSVRLAVFSLVALVVSRVTARHRRREQARAQLLAEAEAAREVEQRSKEQLAATTTEQLDRALAEAELLNRIAQAATGEANLDHILSAVLEHLNPLIAFTGGSIALVEKESLVIRAAWGPHAANALGQSLPRGRGRLWQVIETGEPFLVGDFEVTAYQPSTPLRSYLAVPLSWHGQSLGLLEIDSTEPHAFNQADLPLVQRVATLLSGPIEMARRYAEEVRALAVAEGAQKRLLIQYTLSVLLAESKHFNDASPWILKIVGERLGWEVGAIWCIDWDANVLR
nr:PAS domain-containing sensor histidine kinase [Ardenticatenales bacterium]